MWYKKFDELSGGEVYEILKVRAAVFMMEQGIRYLDMDDIDYRSMHFMEKDRVGHVTAYLRLYDAEAFGEVNIGRVLTMERGCGLGKKLIEEAEAYAKQKRYAALCCDAQAQTVSFYERCGFRRISDEFTEAGIPHVRMRKALE